MKNEFSLKKLSFIGVIISVGIIYGDIGTSPLYVMKALLVGAKGMTGVALKDFVYGVLSCIFWTLTLLTTIKYVIITLKADNKGEGGILALYALIRKRKRWIYLLAAVGAASLLSDGIITPAITVVSAIEGLIPVKPDIPVLPISITVISVIFIAQQFGTAKLGKSFGPIMIIWFGMLAVLGLRQIYSFEIFKSLNPYYAIQLLSEHPTGFFLLGFVFLCTTGAEALYADLGHCGLKNIRISWIFVKISLVLNYFGQGSYIIHQGSVENISNPFFEIMPESFRITGVIISAIAAIIASQALISGSFTNMSEAISLNFWPRVRINYPSTIKGQMYIPLVNWFLMLGCIFVVVYFKESSAMDAAYGLAINFTMLMTTFLLAFYLYYKGTPKFLVALFLFAYLVVEIAFLTANLKKFFHGGWFTLLLMSIIFTVMYVWYRGRNIKKRYTQFVKINDYRELLSDIKVDKSINKYATNLVYLTRADHHTDIESKIIYSIINKQPKRADLYYFVHVHIDDEPYTQEFSVETLIPDTLIRIEFRIGFRVETTINLYFRQVVNELVRKHEVDILSRYESLKKHKIAGDFRFVLIERVLNREMDLTTFERTIMTIYQMVRKIGITDVSAFGLDTSNVLTEKVPLSIRQVTKSKLKRIEPVHNRKDNEE